MSKGQTPDCVEIEFHLHKESLLPLGPPPQRSQDPEDRVRAAPMPLLPPAWATAEAGPPLRL